MTKLIPDEVKTAAKRGFIRTTAQGYEGVLAAGISANIVVACSAARPTCSSSVSPPRSR